MIRSYFSNLVYDSQSGKYINTQVKSRIYDFTLYNSNNIDNRKKYINDVMNKNHVIVLSSSNNISYELKEKLNQSTKLSIIINNEEEMNNILKHYGNKENQVEVCFNINDDISKVDMIKTKDLINNSSINGLITTSIININSDIDLYKIENIVANLVDYNSQFILLSLNNLYDGELVKEMTEMAFNIDCEGNPVSARLGLFFNSSKYVAVINTKVNHIGIDHNNTKLINDMVKMKLL
jgi:hypothetical protein